MREAYTIVENLEDSDCDDETSFLPSDLSSACMLTPVVKLPKLFLHAKVAQRRQSVFPVPVGLSNSALHFCAKTHTKVHNEYPQHNKLSITNNQSQSKW